MRQRLTFSPKQDRNRTESTVDVGFVSLFYRFLFFDWLFADMSRKMDLFERRLAWQHNQESRPYLLTYLRRWSMLAVAAFGLGCLFDRGLEASVVAAWFFTWFCVDLSAMIVIISLWLLLSKLEMS